MDDGASVGGGSSVVAWDGADSAGRGEGLRSGRRSVAGPVSGGALGLLGSVVWHEVLQWRLAWDHQAGRSRCHQGSHQVPAVAGPVQMGLELL